MFIYGKTAANAIALMSYLAANPERRIGSGEIAKHRVLSLPLTAKLLTQLSVAGLVKGHPGPHGGYTLAKPAASISLLDIARQFESIEQPPMCLFGQNWCGVGNPCPLHFEIIRIMRVNQDFLEKTALSVFSKKPT